MPPSLIALNLGTLSHLGFEQQLSVSRKSGYDAVGLHMAQCETYLYTGHSAQDALCCLNENAVHPVEMTFLPDWATAAGRDRRHVMIRAEYIFSLMQMLRCPLLVANTLWGETV